MSDYKYTDPEGDSLTIRHSVDPDHVFLHMEETVNGAALIIPVVDVPRVALELLKAAGYGNEANPLAANDAIADLNGIITELEVIANTKQPA